MSEPRETGIDKERETIKAEIDKLRTALEKIAEPTQYNDILYGEPFMRIEAKAEIARSVLAEIGDENV